MGGIKSSHSLRTAFIENRTFYCVAVFVAVVLSAGCGGGSGSSGQIEPTPTASVNPTAVQATPSPSAELATSTPTSTAQPTALPPTEVPPAPTADTRVPIRDLPTADQVQLGKDAKYFVADRGDGCMWVEYLRENRPEIGLKVFLRTDCPADFGITFQPESGIVLRLVS